MHIVPVLRKDTVSFRFEDRIGHGGGTNESDDLHLTAKAVNANLGEESMRIEIAAEEDEERRLSGCLIR